MQVVYPYCAGLDVHKLTVVACRITTLDFGKHGGILTRVNDHRQSPRPL